MRAAAGFLLCIFLHEIPSSEGFGSVSVSVSSSSRSSLRRPCRSRFRSLTLSRRQASEDPFGDVKDAASKLGDEVKEAAERVATEAQDAAKVAVAEAKEATADAAEDVATQVAKGAEYAMKGVGDEVINALTERVELPGGLSISPIGVGAWAWGDSLFWGYSSAMDEELQESFESTVSNGINFFDTAEVYGFGKSEYLCGKFRRDFSGPSNLRDDIVIASKFAPLPIPGRLRSKDVVECCKRSLDRMGLETMDLYQLHWPGVVRNVALWDGLADCVDQGLVKAVGVSNYGPDLLRSAHAALRSRGVPLATNQIQYSLLSRDPEMSGLLDTCRDLDVKVLAYSPLAQGLLTGKYTAANPPVGPRGRLFKRILPKIAPLITTMESIGDAHGKTPAQVALNWCMKKGTIPIPGAKNPRQAEQNAGSLGWSLTDKEMAMLDSTSKSIDVQLKSFGS